MPWRATRPMDQRAEFVLKAEQEEVPFRELCEEFGVSPKTGYKWVARFRAGGIAALEPGGTPRGCGVPDGGAQGRTSQLGAAQDPGALRTREQG